MKRAIVIVMDSVGIGELPDAIDYHDIGANTLEHIFEKVPNFRMPNLEALGVGNIDTISCIERADNPTACFCRLLEKSKGKDTITGHWEIAGITLDYSFPVFPNGFPDDLIENFEKAIGKKTIGNVAASGTEILDCLGEEHVETGCPIVYTSADSVFQIAAHEEVIKIDELYNMCKIARKMLIGKYTIGRVIARPFIGQNGNYKRTDRRRDFSLFPIKDTMLDYAVQNNYQVKAVGKIKDIFNGRGITESIHTHGNMDGVDQTIKFMKQDFDGIIFTNLVDFDMLFGHRNDVLGYANALIEFDKRIPEIINNMSNEDILFITADHGCDPTFRGTDHTREYVPLLVYGKNLKSNINLGTRESFCDIAETILEFLNINKTFNAKSFYKDIIGGK